MSFVFWAALAVAGFVVGPIVAHLLRRGRAREREFPAAALVPPLTSTARQRSRLEDYPLLVLRAAMIVGLAVLGATPLVRCQRLSLERNQGASVAMAFVLDDSLSMRDVLSDGTSRWDTAKKGASDLLHSARSGDSVAIVLAGRPARIALAPTTDLAAARQALDDLRVSDRATDLGVAVALARTAVRSLPQKDRRVVVLSDLAGDPIEDGAPAAVTPLASLAEPAGDCGITAAERRAGHVTVSVACSSDDAAKNRAVEVLVGEVKATSGGPDAGAKRAAKGDMLATSHLGPRRGEQTLSFDVPARGDVLDARLTGHDAAEHDDTAPVSLETTAPVVGVVADPSEASAKTGGPTVIEQALGALGQGWVARPLAFVPDDENGLDDVGALVIDDPPGFSPEARAALARFLQRGGVGLALLGRRSASTELGFPLEPFARGAVRWEEASGLGIDAMSIGWLGVEGKSLAAIARRGRARLDGTELDGARVIGKWSDGVPWIVERKVGLGVATTVGLPASLDDSDLALRPGFLSLLDHVLHQAESRKGSRRTVAGVPWTFSAAKDVAVTGPDGPVVVTTEHGDAACTGGGDCEDTVERAVPAVRGRYTAKIGSDAEERTVTLDPAEILAEPHAPKMSTAGASAAGTTFVDSSREVALVLIGLFAAELALRIGRRIAARRAAPAA
jgi:hypothetical protein